MSGHRRLVSVFLAGHLAAIGVSAIPSAGSLSADARVPGAPPNAVSAAVTPRLDRLARTSAAVLERLDTVVAPVRRATGPYLQRLGLYQTWRMFTSPPRYDSYVRMRYFVASPKGGSSVLPAFVATELIYPAGREDRVKLLQYQNAYRNKALSNAMDRFHVQYAAQLVRPRGDFMPGEAGRHLAPLARYYTRRFTSGHLSNGERVVRAELWHGVAENGVAGSAAEALRRASRQVRLQRFYDGPVEEPIQRQSMRPLMSEDHDGDVTWALEHVEQW